MLVWDWIDMTKFFFFFCMVCVLIRFRFFYINSIDAHIVCKAIKKEIEDNGNVTKLNNKHAVFVLHRISVVKSIKIMTPPCLF